MARRQPGSFLDVANSDKVQCSLAGNTLTCTAAGGDVTLAAQAGSFEAHLLCDPKMSEELLPIRAGYLPRRPRQPRI